MSKHIYPDHKMLGEMFEEFVNSKNFPGHSIDHPDDYFRLHIPSRLPDDFRKRKKCFEVYLVFVARLSVEGFRWSYHGIEVMEVVS
jgi:hypothetical protein